MGTQRYFTTKEISSADIGPAWSTSWLVMGGLSGTWSTSWAIPEAPVSSFVAATSGFTGGGSPDIVVPAHTPGNILVLFIDTQGYGPSSSPTGWNYRGSRNVVNDAGDSVTLLAYDKVGAGETSAPGFSSGSAYTAWACAAYAGVTFWSIAFNDSNTPTNTPDSTSYSQAPLQPGTNVIGWAFRPQSNIATSGSNLRQDVGATNIGCALSDKSGLGTTTATKTGASAWAGAIVNLQ